MKRLFFVSLLLFCFLFPQEKKADTTVSPSEVKQGNPASVVPEALDKKQEKPVDLVVSPSAAKQDKSQDIVASPLDKKQEKPVIVSASKSLNNYLNIMTPRLDQWKQSKEKGDKTPSISNAQIIEESKMLVDAQKSLSVEDLATLYQAVGDYFFDHNKIWLNVEYDVGNYLKSNNMKDLKKYIQNNQSVISSNYDIYLSNVINKEHQLIAENLKKYRDPLMKIYMLSEAYLYKDTGEKFHLLNLYHAYVLYFYRSRGARPSYDYLQGMKDKDILGQFLQSKEFSNFSTMAKMEDIVQEKSIIYRFSMSDLRQGSVFFPYISYKNDDSVKKNFSNFAKSEFFFSKEKDGTKKINRLLYANFGSDYDSMFNFIKEYNSEITMNDLKEENFIDLSNKINLAVSSVEFLSKEEKSDE